MANDQQGLTLLELLIGISILGIIITGLYQALGTGISSYDMASEKQDLLAQARHAMERMVMFVQECDQISTPDSGVKQEILVISERLMDTYDNTSQAYTADGDGLLDADNDGDDIVNEDDSSPDPAEWISFYLDKSDSTNWKLMGSTPNYSTGTLNDYNPAKIICEHVGDFACTLLASNLIEIRLHLNSSGRTVNLKTRVKSKYLD